MLKKKLSILMIGIMILSLSFLVSGCGSPESENGLPEYTLTVNFDEEKGTVEPAGGDFEENTLVTLTVTSKENWKFDGWSGADADNVSTVNKEEGKYKINMNSDKEITANFVSVTKTEELSSDITEDTTLTSDITYIVTDNINVKSKLTIESGTTIKFEAETGLRILRDGGALITDGTADNKILFTGTSEQPGWWHGIWIQSSTNLNNKLDHVIVEYGGNDNAPRYSSPANVIVGSDTSYDDASIEITNTIMRHSKNYGLYVKSGGSLTGFTDNTITNNDRPVHVNSTQVHNLDTGTSYTGNEDDIVYVDGSSELKSDKLDSEDLIWKDLGLPYQIQHSSNEQMIIWDISLTINPGVKIKFEAGGGIQLISQQGALIADGNADNKILFTATDPQPGWWDGIWIKDSSNLNNKLDNVIVEYGGNDDVNRYSSPANVIVGSRASSDSSSIDIINSTLSYSDSYGLYVFGNGEVNDDWETANEFENNADGKSNIK